MPLPKPFRRPAQVPQIDLYKNPTAGGKMIEVGKRFGYSGIKNQQGSSRVLYHFLPFDGRTLFQFFKNVNTVQFPFTNLTQNKLEVAESIVIERMHLSIITVSAITGDVTASLELQQAGLSNIYRSDLNFLISNNQVIKPINVQSFQPQFNWASNWGSLSTVFAGGLISSSTGNSVWHGDSLPAIPPLIEFQFNLQTDGYVAVANMFLGLTVEGKGAIMAPRTTF